MIRALAGYTSRDFCVMKYEAKNPGALGIPVSQPSGTPWVNVVRGLGPNTPSSAWKACRDLGPGYDLISNSEWQTVARDIADNAWNWSGGAVNSGQLNQGHSDNSPASALAADPNDNLGCSGTTGGTTCTDGVWSNQRRTNRLSSGSLIWDFGGNVSEWVKDSNYNTGTINYISTFNSGDWIHTGFGNDQFCASPSVSPWCGFGYGFVDGAYNLGAVIRGGYWADTVDAGVFEAYLRWNPASNGNWAGFRCVFRPSTPIDVCDRSPSIGTSCIGGPIYAGKFYDDNNYMVTPGNCTDSTAPTCSGTIDSVNKVWSTATGNHNGASGSVDGAANTVYLLTAASGATAAKYCSDMVYGGYSDWFLPARDELVFLYANRSVLGGFDTGNYWSSTQTANSTAAVVQFSGGTVTSATKTSLAFVRCIRRY